MVPSSSSSAVAVPKSLHSRGRLATVAGKGNKARGVTLFRLHLFLCCCSCRASCLLSKGETETARRYKVYKLLLPPRRPPSTACGAARWADTAGDCWAWTIPASAAVTGAPAAMGQTGVRLSSSFRGQMGSPRKMARDRQRKRRRGPAVGSRRRAPVA